MIFVLLDVVCVIGKYLKTLQPILGIHKLGDS
jgi:hypothetical protein